MQVGGGGGEWRWKVEMGGRGGMWEGEVGNGGGRWRWKVEGVMPTIRNMIV